TGDKIKIAPAGEDGLGIFFVNPDGGEIPLDHPMAENNPKMIICRLPQSVLGGPYTLKIVTRYTSGRTTLKTPRTVLYELPLTAEAPLS
ncbi:MAG: DUF4469 domain-containing protein, partial [Tannerella sp.]|nr:DUF4469 domain-containing protein [Tannerella sp.]